MTTHGLDRDCDDSSDQQQRHESGSPCPRALTSEPNHAHTETPARVLSHRLQRGMDESAFHSKLHAEVNQNIDRNSDDFDSNYSPSNRDSPNMDLQFDVEVQCPLDLAPLQYLENFESPDFEYRYSRVMKSADPLLSARDSESEFFLYMTVHCPASFTSGLPSLFGWLIRSCDFHKTIISAP